MIDAPTVSPRPFTTAAFALVLWVTGCDTNLRPQTIEVGLSDHPPSAGVTTSDEWQSVAWLGPDDWLRYPGRSTVVMEHELGRAPAIVLVYLSFEADGSGAALTAGDTARIVSVDDSFVTIRNDTDEDFFMRVVIR